MVKNTTAGALWTSVNPVPTQYPWLKEDIDCEVAVVGGGVTAALCALRFAKAGYDTVMIGASPIGYGGTSVSSGMMSVDGEQCMATLVDHIGSDHAMMAVEQMKTAINNIEELCNSFGDSCGFKRMDSLRYTSEKKYSAAIRREYSLRLHNGIDAELLSALNAPDYFTFPMEAGVYSKGIGAQIDPYRFAHAVVAAAMQSGARVYENTCVDTIHKEYVGKVELDCSYGSHVDAQYVIVAAGLDTDDQCGGIDKSATMYTVVTEPLSDFQGWRGPCLIHSEESPHVFLTVTPDNRAMIGELGSPLMDEKGYIAGVLDMSGFLERHYDNLEKRLRSMFPAIRNITAEYVYAARTGRTEDGLPVLGRLPDEERVAYALCCGDDGLLYSEMASRLLLKQYEGETFREMALFSPRREWRVKQ